MYQRGGYQPNPAYSNQYAQYPQQYQQGAMPMGQYPQQYQDQGAMPMGQYPQQYQDQGAKPMGQYPQQYQGAMPMGQYPQQYQQGAMPMPPYGAAQQSYQNRHNQAPGPGREYENRSENPCRCCCGLATAAKVLAVINLVYLAMELVDLLVADSPFFWGRSTHPSSNYLLVSFHYCRYYQTEEESWFYFITLIIFISSIAVYIVATIGFMVGIFGNLGSKIELLCSKIFMWTSFCYLGWLCHLLLFTEMLVMNDLFDCGGFMLLWVSYIFFAVLAAVISVYNGLVGKGFRNMVQRRSKESAKVPQDNSGEVQATEDTPPGEESVPMEEENSKLLETEQA